MSFSSGNEKIDKYLDELSEEYKALLFKALLAKSIEIDDLSVSELLRIDSEIKKPLFLENTIRSEKYRKFLLIGLVYALVGFFLYIISSTIFKENLFELVSLVMTFVGLAVSILSWYRMKYPSGKSRQNVNLSKPAGDKLLEEYQVVMAWRDIEGMVSDLVADNKPTAAKSVIQYLKNEKIIDSAEEEQLRQLLKTRNEIVHGSTTEISSEVIKASLGIATELISRLTKFV